jgi:carboxypeptidase C (cathepsin A)
LTGIRIETEKDIQLLKAIARTGLITENLLPMLGITRQRLRQHIISGNIEKKGTYMLFGSLTNIYTLTEHAKRRMRSDFLINIYKSDATQLEHDYVLSKIYIYLRYDQKESWKTEGALQQMYGINKTTDGLFISNGCKIGVEVITDSYSKEEIEQKKNFIRKYCDDYIMVHTHKNIEYVV